MHGTLTYTPRKRYNRWRYNNNERKILAQIFEDEKRSTGTLLRCHNPACNGKTWRYKGKMKIYAVCPDCRRAVRIATNTVDEIVNATVTKAE